MNKISFLVARLQVVLLLIVLAVLGLPFFTFAQEQAAVIPVAIEDPAPVNAPRESNSVIIANINLAETTLVEQTPEFLKLSFILQNLDQKPQSDIRYGVELIKNIGGRAQVVVDSFVYPENITLNAQQNFSKEIMYPIGTVAPGTYTIWITAKTAGGTMLGLGNAGEITVANTTTLEIKTDTCVLFIAGEGEGLTYRLNQGVDVAATEDMVLTCAVKNHSATARAVLPNFETFVRTVHGDKVEMNQGVESQIYFAAGEEKDISLTIPKATQPQAYDVAVTFADTTTRAKVSNQLIVHYVLRGASATIQTVDFTKPSYQAGEEIMLKLTWSGSADSFSGSRQGQGTEIGGVVLANVQIVDGLGQACAPQFTKELSTEIIDLTTIATTNCLEPAATIQLVGPDTTVLDTSSIASPKKEEVVEVVEEVPVPVSNNKRIYVAASALVFVLIVILVIVMRHRRKSTVEPLVE